MNSILFLISIKATANQGAVECSFVLKSLPLCLTAIQLLTGSQGQIESKKRSKKHQGNEIQTKGTAMSFGFRKNLNTTPKKLKKLIKGETKSSKKQDKCNNFCEDESATDGTGNGERLTTAMGKTETIVNNPAVSRDDNGNAVKYVEPYSYN
uniref:Uncharacterized protein n=1 Tax=Glossina austeni TaxID=7395 RepID=A0A1A9VT37_GLOAU